MKNIVTTDITDLIKVTTRMLFVFHLSHYKYTKCSNISILHNVMRSPKKNIVNLLNDLLYGIKATKSAPSLQFIE